MLIKRSFLVTALLLFATSLTFSVFTPIPQASAVTASDWKPGRIIDDAVFTDKNSMSVSDVQNFLNQKVGTGGYDSIPGQCDTNGVRNAQPYSSSSRANYATSINKPSTFTCLKDYYEVPKTSPGAGLPANNYGGAPIPSGAQSAAQLIWNAAQTYNINPKVLLVMIQKESAGPLTTDDWPFLSQFTYAMGAHCPDSGPGGSANCDANYAGFSIQISESAKLLRTYLDGMDQPWWGCTEGGAKVQCAGNRSGGSDPGGGYKVPYATNYILWDIRESGCSGANIYIENRATAALYYYTPYQPNHAALNNMYGTGDGCSAYGNRNFWRIFNDWFGSTTGPDYAWEIESFAYSGGDNSIALGQTETITLRARNTGRVPWYNHGNHPIRLGTWEPAERSSPLANQTWPANNRLANMQESAVQPSEIGTFTFQITPSKIGSYIEGLNLVAENYQWLKWPGLRPTIQVTSPYQWQVENIIYQNGTGLMEPGTAQLITVIVKNTGTVVWDKNGANPVRLGTWLPDRQSPVISGWRSPSRIDINDSIVNPGETAGFQFYVYMPRGGLFYERFNLVAEGLTWLNDPGLTLYLQGKNITWQPLWHSHSAGTANMLPGETQDITVKVKNTGEKTWSKTGPSPVKLATVAPQDRGSAFYHPSWLRDTRPALLQEETVQPGQEGTFKFTIKAPSTRGPWYERFSLVMENQVWLNDPNLSVYVNVR